MSNLNQVLDVLVAIVNLLGVPAAIAIFVRTKKREKFDREIGTYSALNQQYIDFLTIAFENPKLPIFGKVGALTPLKPEEDRQVECAFLMIISLIENAYLLYRQHSSKIRECQWAGWRDYICDYFSNPYFEEKWPELGCQFDRDFVKEIDKLLIDRSIAPEKPSPG